VLAFLRGEVGGIDVIHGTLGDEARLEHGAQVGEDEILKTLLTNVVEEKRTDHVGGERHDVMALEPGTFAGTGESDREDYDAFGRSRWRSGDDGWRLCALGRGRGLELSGIVTRGCVGVGVRAGVLAYIGDDAFGGGGSECLGDGLFATTTSAAATSATSAAASALAFAGWCLRARRRGGFLASGQRFELGLARCGRFEWLSLFLSLAMRRRVILSGVGGFRRQRGPLFRVKVGGLQGRGRGLTSLLRGFLLAHTIAHPFTHVQACNTDDGGGAIGVEPWMTVPKGEENVNHRGAQGSRGGHCVSI
jgi:hypothetical protein